MKTALLRSCLVLCGMVCMEPSSAAQPPVGALAIDEGQGDRYGWAVDYETASAARSAAFLGVRPGLGASFGFGAATALWSRKV